MGRPVYAEHMDIARDALGLETGLEHHLGGGKSKRAHSMSYVKDYAPLPGCQDLFTYGAIAQSGRSIRKRPEAVRQNVA